MENVSKYEMKLTPKKIFIAILKGIVAALALITIIAVVIWIFVL